MNSGGRTDRYAGLMVVRRSPKRTNLALLGLFLKIVIARRSRNVLRISPDRLSRQLARRHCANQIRELPPITLPGLVERLGFGIKYLFGLLLVNNESMRRIACQQTSEGVSFRFPCQGDCRNPRRSSSLDQLAIRFGSTWPYKLRVDRHQVLSRSGECFCGACNSEPGG